VRCGLVVARHNGQRVVAPAQVPVSGLPALLAASSSCVGTCRQFLIAWGGRLCALASVPHATAGNKFLTPLLGDPALCSSGLPARERRAALRRAVGIC
jgi:hypothetical protein